MNEPNMAQKQSLNKSASISIICGIIGFPFSAFIIVYYVLYTLTTYKVNESKPIEYILILSIFASICFGIIAIAQSRKAKKINCTNAKNANIGIIFGFIDIAALPVIIVIELILFFVELVVGFYGLRGF